MTTIEQQKPAEAVAERLAVCLPEINFDPVARPSSMAIDSMDLVSLLCTIDQEFGVRLTADEFQKAPTVEALLEIVATRSKSQSILKPL